MSFLLTLMGAAASMQVRGSDSECTLPSTSRAAKRNELNLTVMVNFPVAEGSMCIL